MIDTKGRTKSTVKRRILTGTPINHGQWKWLTPTTLPVEGDLVSTPQSVTHEVLCGEKSRNYFKNCVHNKRTVSCDQDGSLTGSFRQLDGKGKVKTGLSTVGSFILFKMDDFTSGSLTNDCSISHFSNPGDYSPIEYDESLNTYSRRAFKAMSPTVDDLSGGFSGVNFLAELRDAKSMFKLWDSSLSAIKNFSSSVLNWNFAIKPTLQDMSTMYSGLSALRESVSRWNTAAKEGTIFTRHYIVEHDYTLKGSPSGEYIVRDLPFGEDHNEILRYEREVLESSLRFHMSYKPRHLAVDDLDKIMFYFDYFGLGDGFSIPWNFLKLSFVVDWFITVGDFLEQFERDTFTYPFELVDYSYSRKIKTRSSINIWREYREDGSTGAYTYGGYTDSGTLEDSFYRRQRIPLPYEDGIDWGLLRVKFPSAGQAWLGANLANYLGVDGLRSAPKAFFNDLKSVFRAFR